MGLFETVSKVFQGGGGGSSIAGGGFSPSGILQAGFKPMGMIDLIRDRFKSDKENGSILTAGGAYSAMKGKDKKPPSILGIGF
jgi:hypothetical protein